MFRPRGHLGLIRMDSRAAYPRLELPPAKRRLVDAFLALGVGKEVSDAQLKAQMGLDRDDQKELRKRVTELRTEKQIDVHYVHRQTGRSIYVLRSLDLVGDAIQPHAISAKIKAEVLHGAGRRCQMCGKTVEGEMIKLVVDHRVPRSWGGTDDIENLEALCDQCNGGKQAFFATLDSAIMRKCMNFDLPIQRIGELLKAFRGQPPPRRLIAAVGMDDEWTRRLRELRDLGWTVAHVRVKGEKRANRHSYRLIKSRRWPADVKAAVKAAAKGRGAKSFG